jgi:hypothetical protein
MSWHRTQNCGAFAQTYEARAAVMHFTSSSMPVSYRPAQAWLLQQQALLQLQLLLLQPCRASSFWYVSFCWAQVGSTFYVILSSFTSHMSLHRTFRGVPQQYRQCSSRQALMSFYSTILLQTPALE